MSLGQFAKAGVWPLISGGAIVAAFATGIWRLSRREPAAGLSDAHAALDVVAEIYKRSGYDFGPNP